jgi:MarR family transcriptional regulator for hemolysin
VLNQKDLARLVGIESSTLVRQLDALEARGLIERVVDRDRRARLVKMTPAAIPVIERIKQLADDLGREILAGIDGETVTECAGVLKLMRERLRERTKNESAAAAEEPAERKRVRA